MTRDGFVAGWHRTFVSPDGEDRVTVALLQMASPQGASDDVPVSMRPYLFRRGWSFAPVADGFGAVALQRSIPDAAGTYGDVIAQPVSGVVLLIETHPPRVSRVIVDLINVA